MREWLKSLGITLAIITCIVGAVGGIVALMIYAPFVFLGLVVILMIVSITVSVHNERTRPNLSPPTKPPPPPRRPTR